MLRSLKVVLAAMPALVASPAMAQTAPTLEGAMRFLELALPGHDYLCNAACEYKTYTIDTAEKTGPCVIRLNIVRPNSPAVSGPLNLARATEVRVSSIDTGTVIINLPGVELWVNVKSPAHAARLAYAANYARLKCDVTASTGF